MKVALLLPGYLDSPDYLHMMIFEKRLQKLGYTVERMDLCNLWKTGDTKQYTITNSLNQVKERIDYYKNQNPEEILLIGHSRGAFLSIIAGARMPEVAKVVALCAPPGIGASANKWVKGKLRVSQRDLPDDPTKFREFAVPYSFVEDIKKYSAIDEAKNIHKPFMIFIALDDDTVLPADTEKIVDAADNPYVVRQPNMGHSFRQSTEETNIVMDEIEKFLKLPQLLLPHQ